MQTLGTGPVRTRFHRDGLGEHRDTQDVAADRHRMMRRVAAGVAIIAGLAAAWLWAIPTLLANPELGVWLGGSLATGLPLGGIVGEIALLATITPTVMDPQPTPAERSGLLRRIAGRFLAVGVVGLAGAALFSGVPVVPSVLGVAATTAMSISAGVRGTDWLENGNGRGL